MVLSGGSISNCQKDLGVIKLVHCANLGPEHTAVKEIRCLSEIYLISLAITKKVRGFFFQLEFRKIYEPL